MRVQFRWFLGVVFICLVRAVAGDGVTPDRCFEYNGAAMKVEAEQAWRVQDLSDVYRRVFCFRVAGYDKGNLSTGFSIQDRQGMDVSFVLYNAPNGSWGILTGSFRCPGSAPFVLKPKMNGAGLLPVGNDFLGHVGPGSVRDHEISLYLRKETDGWGVWLGDAAGGETALTIPFALLPAESALRPFVSLGAGLSGSGPLSIILPSEPAAVVPPETGLFGSVKYRFYQARVEPGKLYPLVVCLHGAGGVGDDNRGRGIHALGVLMQAAVQAEHPCFVLAPQKPAPLPMWADWDFRKGSYDLDQVSETVHIKSVHDLILKVMSENPIDPARIYVTGQSMGGFGTWDIALRYPELFAAAVPLCGGGSPNHAARLKKMAVWAFHGDQDTAVPVSGSREMAAALKAAGAVNARYTEYPGEGHVIMEKVWNEDGILDWLFSWKKGGVKEL